MKHLYLLAGSLFIFAFASAQSFQYKKYNFEWAPGHPESIPVEDQFKNEDAVILDEKVIYDIGGNQIPPYYFLNHRANYFYIGESTSGLSPIVQKHVRIKFLTSEGIKKFSTIILPESFDPTSDWSTVRPELRDSIYRPKGEFECIRYFAARILRADGTIGNAVLDEKTQMELNRHNKINSKLFNWMIRIINLEPGDELELDYSYEGAFNIDPSTRIFFNGDIPKQNFHLTMRYPEHDYYILTYANGVKPYDSIMVSKKNYNGTEYFFSMKNLPGGLRECGGRPYTQYPYITYYKHEREYGIMDQKTKFITRPLPYPWSYIAAGLAGYQYDNLKMRLGRMDNATRVMNAFVDQERSKAGDTSLASIMSTVQHTLAKDFQYQSDNEYYEGDGKGLERLGHYVENKIVREISRHRIYDEVLTRL